MFRPSPLGLSGDRAPTDPMTPYAGTSTPGPLGTASNALNSPSVEDSAAGAFDPPLEGSIGFPFAVGADTYRLRRVDTDWQLGRYEVQVPPEDAVAIVERAIVRHRKSIGLLRLLETAVSQLAGLHENGTFVLLQLRPPLDSERGAAPPPAPMPRPSRPPAPSEPPAPVQEPMMAAVQATVLKNAAASGVPFCEECARAAAQRAAAGR